MSLSRPRGLVTALAAAGLILSLAAGCSSPAPEPTPTETVAPTVEPTETPTPTPEPEPEPAVVWPLTGVAVDEVAQRPAVAVKIENTAAARPQTGLNEADVVWETIIEFDVSRLMAVFHSNYPTDVGPIRSVRPVDMRIYSPLKPVFVFSGGQKGILNLVREAPGHWVEENRGVSQMWRAKDRRAPHNLYGSVEGLATLAPELTAAPPQQFVFAPTAQESAAIASGAVTSTIDLNMSAAAKPGWDWDAATNSWLRREGKTKATVSGGDQIRATNVVIIEVKAVDSGFDAQNKAPVPDNILEGTGTAIIATGGKTVEATWSKADQNAPLVLLTATGEPAPLAPGNTWVELLPQPQGTYTLTP